MKTHFKRLEILGNVDNLSQPDFFYTFILEGGFKIEELIIDSIFTQKQL